MSHDTRPQNGSSQAATERLVNEETTAAYQKVKGQHSSRWQIGDRIENRWDVKNIFSGGMGEVYLVYDNDFELPFVAKTLKLNVLERSAAGAVRFRHELRTWIKLDRHPNITWAAFIQRIDPIPLLFLEYVDGGNLAEWIGTSRLANDLPQVLRFAIQFCDGMCYATSNGITAHRDIKPANCLITHNNILKITDFGLAKTEHVIEGLPVSSSADEHSDEKTSLTQTGMVAGTPAYMAPEQFGEFKNVDIRADIYSFGVMLHEMITGRRPFVADSWHGYEHAHRAICPPKIEKTTPSAVREIAERCLSKEPNARFDDFAVLKNQLESAYLQLTGQRYLSDAIVPDLKNDSTSWKLKAGSLTVLGCYEDALYYIDKVLSIEPDSHAAWLEKAKCCAFLERHDEAIECWDQLIKLRPHDGMAQSMKMLALSELGRNDEALRFCDDVLRASPCDESFLVHKATILTNLRRLKQAEECFAKALEQNPKNDHAWREKGCCLAELGQHDDALNCFNRVLDILNASRPNQYQSEAMFTHVTWGQVASGTHLLKAQSFFALKRFKEAVASCDSALELDPLGHGPTKLKGISLAVLGQHHDALVCLDRALQEDTSDALVWKLKSECLIRTGREAEGRDCLEKVKKLSGTQEQHNRRVPLEQVAYVFAYTFFPGLVFERDRLFIKLNKEYVGKPGAPDVAQNLYCKCSELMHEIPQREVAAQFRSHKGKLGPSYHYFAIEYPRPRSFAETGVLAPLFSCYVESEEDGSVQYFVLGQSPSSAGLMKEEIPPEWESIFASTLRTVTADGRNINCGPGGKPELPLFLERIREYLDRSSPSNEAVSANVNVNKSQNVLPEVTCIECKKTFVYGFRRVGNKLYEDKTVTCVPCPNCGFYQQQMVDALKFKRAEPVVIVGLITAVIFFCIGVHWTLYWDAKALLWYGAGILVVIAVVLISKLLMRMCNPNRAYYNGYGAKLAKKSTGIERSKLPETVAWQNSQRL